MAASPSPFYKLERPTYWSQAKGITVQNDVTYLAIILGLFVVSVLFVQALDKMIGPDEVALGRRTEDSRDSDSSIEQEAA